MIALNLLSPEERLDSSLKWNYLIVKNVILMVLVVTTAVALVLFSAKLTLRKRLAEAEVQLERINITRSQANKEIQSANQLIKELSTAQDSFMPWSSVLWELLQGVTPGIQLKAINLNKNTGTIILTGRADTRDQLLAFRDSLDQQEMITETDVPLTNLLKKEDIDFTVNIQFSVTDTLLYE